jgi:hypothetical protein
VFDELPLESTVEAKTNPLCTPTQISVTEKLPSAWTPAEVETCPLILTIIPATGQIGSVTMPSNVQQSPGPAVPPKLEIVGPCCCTVTLQLPPLGWKVPSPL